MSPRGTCGALRTTWSTREAIWTAPGGWANFPGHEAHGEHATDGTDTQQGDRAGGLRGGTGSPDRRTGAGA
ncbi:hypothetical protein GCM10017668_60780 [Streptomyces tuirus]|uniref:Uncharacterized protein n=1 Tax=Streptomyces tuirus TaxID=68278 RepID=A0A7G1NSZ6_9ACTN|nr:hypothetical protein GCM10017668_60780 [Streptomyces tuirus]